MLDIKEKRHITVVGRGGASNIEWDDIQDKPDFATVATSGSYNDLTDKPEIPGQVNADWDANSGVAQILNKPTLATVATSGSYNDLSNTPNLATVATSGSYNDLTDKPTIPPQQWFGTKQEYDAIQVKDPDVVYNIEGGQAQANWTENDSSDPSYIQNKPTLATVATSGSYNDLSNTPSLATVATSGSYADLSNTPSLATVATSGSYNDLTNKPDLSHYVEDTDLASVATSGSYNDLSDKPTIPSAQVNADWNASSGVQQILNKPTLATVATTGDYSDLSNTPSLATVATSGSYNDLSNTPSLATVATSGSYSDLSNTPSLATVATSGDYTDLSNKPEIPSVPAMATQELTFTLQGGTTKTIEFYVVPNYFYVEDVSGSNNTLTIKKNSDSATDVEVFYSTDKINWDSMGTTTTTGITATVPANGKLYLKANKNNWGTSSYYNTINCINNFNVGGNIMSLIYSDNFVGKTVFPTNLGNVFYKLFTESLIVSAGNLLLPATAVPSDGYSGMFQNCTSLTTAPAVLPATSIGAYGYNYMFNGCTSLTTAPEIYGNIFGQRACRSMFANCTNLIKIITYNTKLGIQSHADWLYNASATGDFYNLGGATYPSGTSGIPSGWTTHTSL